MKAVNLIPAEERRSGGTGSGLSSYILIGILALVLAVGAAFTLVNRNLKDHRKELADVQAQIQGAQSETEALKAYTAFTTVRQQRSETVRSLATSRFDWAHALHEVARTMPSDAWLTSMRASVTPTTPVDGGVSDPLRNAVQAPAIEIVGCTTSQDKVPGVISSLRRANGVQRISLSSSERLDAGTAAAGSAGGDCRNGNVRFPKFSMTLFFTAPTPTASQGDDAVTARDRIIIVVALVAAALAGVWFVGLAPKRKDATELSAKLDVARQQLTEVQQSAAKARDAKAKYDSDYAQVATLGKAVPKSDAIPSLVYQLQSAAHDASIVFNSLKVANTGVQAATTPSTPAQTAAAANGASNANGSGSTSGGTSGSTSSSTPTTPAPATQAATSTLPPGAAVGSAGFPTMPFSFVFNGTFFDMERFFNEVQRFVRVNGNNVDVRGRLLSIDGFALNAGGKGFPSVKANISATAYLMSPDSTTGVPPAASSSTGTGANGASAMQGAAG